MGGRKRWDWSLFGSPGPGFHLTVNPQKKPKVVDERLQLREDLPPNPKITEIYRKHGLTLRDRDLRALRSGREAGIRSLDGLLREAAPYGLLGPEERLELSTTVADFLMEKSLEAQLSREAPTLLDLEEQRAEKLEHVFKQAVPADGRRDAAPSLLSNVPVGVSITIHLPVDWL